MSIVSFPLFGYDLADYEDLFEEKVKLFAELLSHLTQLIDTSIKTGRRAGFGAFGGPLRQGPTGRQVGGNMPGTTRKQLVFKNRWSGHRPSAAAPPVPQGVRLEAGNG